MAMAAAAFNSILRRASAGVISRVENRLLAGSQFSRFSLTAGGDFVRLLESDCSVRDDMKSSFYNIPKGFPFEIEDTKRSLSLRRMYQDERILLRVQSTEFVFTEPTPYMILSASISRGSWEMDFKLEVLGDHICISLLALRDLNGHLEICKDFLEAREITSSMMDFLFNYIEKTKRQILCFPDKDTDMVQGMFFPFKVNKKKAEYSDLFLALDKKLEDETIGVEVEPVYGQNEILRCLKVFVEVVREDKGLYFLLYARHGQMIIPNMYMSGDLEAFRNILEIRGVNHSTTKFLFDYMREREIG